MLRIILNIPLFYRLVVITGYLITIAILSLLPSNEMPEINVFTGFDKLVHMGMYLGLSVLGCWISRAETKPFRIVFVLILTSLWGLLMEFSQLEMVAGRAFEWMDEIFNIVGALVGAAAYWWLAILKRGGEEVKS